MERRMTLRRALLAVGVLLSVVLLGTCSNDISLLNFIETEVKIANNKFLLVESVDPPDNLEDVNPGNRILIQFDRPLDETTITPANVVVARQDGSAAPDGIYTYNPANTSLSIQPDPYFAGLKWYDITITAGLRGADGSALQQPYAWSFKTRDYPAGSLFFVAKPYALSSSVQMTINVNARVDYYRWVLVNEGVDAATAFGNAGSYPNRQDWTNSQITGLEKSFTVSGTLPSGDGSKVAHFQVREYVDGTDFNDNIPDPVRDATFLDLTDPTASIVSGPTTVRAVDAAAQALDASASDASGSSGIASYAWTAPRISGSGSLTFANSAALDTSVSDPANTADGTFRLTLTVTDKAGRTASAARDVDWDRTPPGISTSGSYYTVSPTLPSWSWSSSATDLRATNRYAYSLDGGTAEYTMSTSYAMSSGAYGPHTLSVTAYDDDNNSSTTSRTIYYSPSVILPYWGQRNVPRGWSDGLVFDWPNYTGGSPPYYYDLYIYTGIRPPTSPTKSDLTTSGYAPGKLDPSLSANTQYYWFFKIYHVYKTVKVYDYTSSTYTFWTTAH